VPELLSKTARLRAPTALKLTHQFHLPSHRHKHPRVGIALQDHRFFAHTSHSSHAIA